MKTFLDDDFLLETEAARELYHHYGKEIPIFDYHSHLSVKDIAENRSYENLTRIWLAGDHYKWRAMRWNGIDEEYITGSASDRDKFRAWAATVPKTVGNPLYHWTHLELKNSFGIDGVLLGPDTADEIYDACREKLHTDRLTPRGILMDFAVRTVYTTDDPADDLEFHRMIADNAAFDTQVLPTFRPDKAGAVDGGEEYRRYIETLSDAAGTSIAGFADLLEALDKRHAYFHAARCRISDHALEKAVFVQPDAAGEAEAVFRKAMAGGEISSPEADRFKAVLVTELARMNARRGWAMQLHIGALRNVNSKMFAALGPDSGFDAINDEPVAKPLARFLDHLASRDELPKTIIYTLNPRDIDPVCALAGCFQAGPVPGKLQPGPAWWFNDTKDGMETQLKSLARTGLLSHFTGMVTDSRSFLSYSRHEYFRRILANLLGDWMARGEAPGPMGGMGEMMQDICYTNAARFFSPFE